MLCVLGHKHSEISGAQTHLRNERHESSTSSTLVRPLCVFSVFSVGNSSHAGIVSPTNQSICVPEYQNSVIQYDSLRLASNNDEDAAASWLSRLSSELGLFRRRLCSIVLHGGSGGMSRSMGLEISFGWKANLWFFMLVMTWPGVGSPNRTTFFLTVPESENQNISSLYAYGSPL